MKAQLLIEPGTRWILSTAFAPGQVHDLTLSQARALRLHPSTTGLVDLGYLGLARQHPQTLCPFKASKKHPLTHEQRHFNRQLARLRIRVEQVIRTLKIFRLLAERYRNRRRRFALRFNLIAGLYNYQLLVQ